VTDPDRGGVECAEGGRKQEEGEKTKEFESRDPLPPFLLFFFFFPPLSSPPRLRGFSYPGGRTR
jgi:hypothetical protein